MKMERASASMLARFALYGSSSVQWSSVGFIMLVCFALYGSGRLQWARAIAGARGRARARAKAELGLQNYS